MPVTVGTSPSSRLLISAPGELGTGVLDDVKATLEESLGGVLGPLGVVVDSAQDVLVDQAFNALVLLVSGVVRSRLPRPTATVSRARA